MRSLPHLVSALLLSAGVVACSSQPPLASGVAVALQRAAFSAQAAACTFQTWQANTTYTLGTTVLYPANGRYYKLVNATAGGSDKTDPTISTWYWQPTTCSGPSSGNKVLGTYYATFAPNAPRLREIHPNYTLIYLFAATNAPGQPAGTLKFDPPPNGSGAWTNWTADLQYVRSTQKRKVLLSVGGAGNAIRFTTRAVSTTFVNSVDKLYQAWGGFDGLDFNTFEGDAAPNTSEMIWIGQELKRRHPGFLITAPPAPWNTADQQFCKAMLTAGALDYCAPQYYDGPQLNDPTYLQNNLQMWVNLLGADHVVVGFGVNPGLANYWTIGSAVNTFSQVKSRFLGLRGAFDWRLDWDVQQGSPFAQQFGPLTR
ncbi:hypothetical protein K7W42_03265 [Deinococcus sp. HMF7604]|uniref:glycosyl hydrolase family 18 protein n=1 Tax=Deinococcus betulae TaxID=2873312 RepID=UPI001CCB3153|nr:glycosyl hydrolase family 18 protein [Deinococcus betulae]MBZ9749878.1 hypothetical protein [Deinococcus betulae]